MCQNNLNKLYPFKTGGILFELLLKTKNEIEMKIIKMRDSNLGWINVFEVSVICRLQTD